jgi:hypothetical protein
VDSSGVAAKQVSSGPGRVYSERLGQRSQVVAALERRSRRLADARLAMFLLIAASAYLALVPKDIPPWTPLAPLVGFVVLVVVHDRALRAQQRARRAVDFYRRGQARLDDRWAGSGNQGEPFAKPEHPYALDVDLFGNGSLFELLCAARTQAGESLLASWLSAPATPAEVVARQGAVRELTPGLDIREDLFTLGAEVRASLDPSVLTRWGEGPAPALAIWLWPLASVLAIAGVVTLLGWWLWGWGAIPLAVVLGVDGLVLRIFRTPLAEIVRAVDKPDHHLGLLSEIVARIERERFTDERLRKLHGELSAGGVAASERIAQLDRLVGLLEARGNQFFAPLAFLLLWTVHLSFAIERWRRECGPHLGTWLKAVGELEALSSLAGYAYEHPDDPFPTVREIGAEGPFYRASGLGHPLLPTARCVRNDISLGGERKLLLVSGSNMSGKSTFLRTVGLNAVLALAGAPVRAVSMELTPVALGATLRVQDSLQAGTSRFYAEITRLKQLFDLAKGKPPLLFLLDELLAGTNSHDRLVGSEALIRELLQRGAIGLLTTHDLALARVADSLAPAAHNAHFADQVGEAGLSFDYRLREGVVQRSNAIELMRAVGLPVSQSSGEIREPP